MTALDRRGLLFALAAIPALPITARAQAPQPPAELVAPITPSSIEVHARPVPSFHLRDRSHTTFGKLRYRSGLVLTSSWRGFGGLSALRLDSSGERFVAISDKSAWFTGRIVYRGGEMTGLADVQTAAMLGGDGKPLAQRNWFDTESLARDGDTLFVGIERVNQIVRFNFAKGGLSAPGEPIALPPALRRLPYNKGLEALALVPRGQPQAGALIALSERGLDANGNIIGALIGGTRPGPLTVRRTEKFDISDAAMLPSGDLLLLERKFSWLDGIGVRIRRIKAASIAPGAMLDGDVIFAADLGEEIDNFEGLDVHLSAEGETVLTLLSDDNFSLLQRTLLLQFTLLDQ
jgi:hypothetical protein